MPLSSPQAAFSGRIGPGADDAGPAHDRVYKHLRKRILHGEMVPGESLTLRGAAAA